MSDWIRYLNLTIQGGPNLTFDGEGLRIRFDIKQHNEPTPSFAIIKITNQNPSDAKQLAQINAEYKSVSIDAGYGDNHGVIFEGNIVRAIIGRENPTDTLTTILAADGDQGRGHAVVNKTFPPGSTPKDHFNAAIQALSKFGISQGFIGQSVDLSTPSYPRSVTLFGMAHEVLKRIARLKGAQVSYQQGKVHMVTPTDSNGGAIELNSKTGLIGMPTLQIGGVIARSLINPQIKVNGQVHIDQSLVQGLLPGLQSTGEAEPSGTAQLASGLSPSQMSQAAIAADGIYRVFKIDYTGDTRGNPWYMDIEGNIPGLQTSDTVHASAR